MAARPTIQLGIKMLKFFREGEFQEYILGTPAEQAEAMKDYLMNLWDWCAYDIIRKGITKG